VITITSNYEHVVLDGANLIHDDKKDKDGNKILLILPERLQIAISHCESLGWPTTAILKKGTYLRALRTRHLDTVGDIEILDKLIADQKVILVNRKKDDIYWIDFALQRNALIITHDKFNDKIRDGVTIQGERSLYTDRDWDDIDRRTLRGHEYIGDRFIVPGLSKKRIIEQDTVTIEMFDRLSKRVIELEEMVREKTHSELKEATISDTDSQDTDELTEIVHSVFEQMLSSGEKVEMSHMQRSIASVVLGHDIETYPKSWPKGWVKELGDSLDFQGTLHDLLVHFSPRKLCRESVRKDGSPPLVVFFC
jgi:hypothetical protein